MLLDMPTGQHAPKEGLPTMRTDAHRMDEGPASACAGPFGLSCPEGGRRGAGAEHNADADPAMLILQWQHCPQHT